MATKDALHLCFVSRKGAPWVDVVNSVNKEEVVFFYSALNVEVLNRKVRRGKGYE